MPKKSKLFENKMFHIKAILWFNYSVCATTVFCNYSMC